MFPVPDTGSRERSTHTLQTTMQSWNNFRFAFTVPDQSCIIPTVVVLNFGTVVCLQVTKSMFHMHKYTNTYVLVVIKNMSNFCLGCSYIRPSSVSCTIFCSGEGGGGGGGRTLLHGAVYWMCAKHSHFGWSGACLKGFFGKFAALRLSLGTFSIPTLMSKMYSKPIHACIIVLCYCVLKQL